ncbi:MAG: DUF4407 domain-containing protein [Deltaproteobacteria bacterium]|nr:DUF4407 domain-containing protein [Deltaproteobacteria bacterium]
MEESILERISGFFRRLQCLLIGYSYKIVCNSSEATVKTVKKYTSAITLIALSWFFIGFVFTQRYLKADVVWAIIGGIISAFAVIQIERQIILSFSEGWQKAGISVMRVLIAVVMAFIGAVILDQIIFREDIEKKKIERVQLEVNRLIPLRAEDLNQQIREIDEDIERKERERAAIAEKGARGAIVTATETTIRTRRGTTRTQKNLPTVNPLLTQLDEQIKELRDRKLQKENEKLRLRQSLEEEVKSRIGFIDELETMKDLILSSWSALLVWLSFFFFFFFIELLVLVVKVFEDDNDYKEIVKFHMDNNKSKLREMRQVRGLSERKVRG